MGSEWSTSMSRLDQRNWAPIIGPFSAWKPPIPCAIKNQQGASKDTLGICVPKPLVGGFGCPNLYGIRASKIGPFSAWKPPMPLRTSEDKGLCNARAGSLWTDD